MSSDDLKNVQNLKYLVALGHFPKFGPRRLERLKNYFFDLKNAFTASLSELKQAKIEENIAAEFIAMRPAIEPDKIWQWLKNEKIKVLTIADNNYSGLLKEIYDPPQLLYYKGKLENSQDYNIAVVGTRKFTAYGRQITEKIVSELVPNKITIVSGLAHGIDTIAHNACLEAGGRTIAVLGSGLDKQNIYPSANRYLAEKIIASEGLIFSEFPLGTPPLRHNFPQRNRIISGLALGSLIVEAGEKSGALITARFALEQNREIFAIPGNVFSPVSIGPNNLIKQGAKTVVKAADIIETLDLAQVTTYIENKKIIPESNEEEIVLSCLSHEPAHIDELVRLTKINTALISSTLIIMEMKGMVKNLGNMQYVLTR